jgi:hypothetical protein
MSIFLLLNLARIKKKMKKTYSTQHAAKKMGISFRTLNRWLNQELIRPSMSFPIGGGRTLWRWTDVDVVRGRKIKASLKPGPKPPRKHKK